MYVLSGRRIDGERREWHSHAERRNEKNTPLTVSRNGTVTTTLTYDGNGARAKKVAGGTTTYYVSGDYEIKNGVATKYVFAGNMRVASVEGTNINNSKIFHKDHLGSSTAITDNTGADTETTEYMPFGVQRSHSGANASDYKYTDQELDSESGLYNYDARLYDPVIGRFISADSVVPDWYNPQSLSRYTYSFNNPLKYKDPDGHSPQLVFCFIGAAIGGVANAIANHHKYETGEMSGEDYAKSIAVGAGLGLLASLGNTAAASIVLGTITSAVNNIHEQTIEGKTFNEMSKREILKSAAIGAASAKKLSGAIGDATAAVVTSIPKNETSKNKDNGTHNEPSPEEQKISPEVQNKLLIREKR
jgi:RHS repeat-associated protein